MTALLEAENVGKIFGGGLFNRKKTAALKNASLVLRDDRPSITAIAGESGSGKTTLARQPLLHRGSCADQPNQQVLPPCI